MPALLLFSSFLLTLVLADQWWKDSPLPDLTATQFKETVGKDKYVFIQFYSKTCPHCESLLPHLNSLHGMLTGPHAFRSDIILARMDGDGEGDKVTDDLGITMFPTLMLFKPHDTKFPDQYSHALTSEHLQGYLKSLPQVSSTSDIAEQKIETLMHRIHQLEESQTNKAPSSTTSLQQIVTEHREHMDASLHHLKQAMDRIQAAKVAKAESQTAPPVPHQPAQLQPTSPPTPPTPSTHHPLLAPTHPTDYDYRHALPLRLLSLFFIGGIFALGMSRLQSIDAAHAKHH